MEIYLWRHGKAEKNSLTGRDKDRALSPEGVNDIKKVVSFVKQKHLGIQKIFTSSYLRAKETAELIQEQLKCERDIEILPELDSGTSTANLVIAIGKFHMDLRSFILVGHMPDLGRLADHLLGQTQSEPTSLKAGGLVIIELKNFEEPFDGKILSTLKP